MEVAAFSDDSEISPQRGRGLNINAYDKGEGKGRAARHTSDKSFLLVPLKVIAKSKGAEVTRKDFRVFLEMRRCKKWAYKISF